MTVTKQQIVKWLENTAAVLNENKDYLIQLDSPIGDADHGINMDRGFNKVLEKLPSMADKDIGNILHTTGMALISSVGGASGPLYGTFFMRGGTALMSKEELSNEDLFTLFQAGVDGIVQRGRAQLGDKTMFDAWSPALHGDDLAEAAALLAPFMPHTTVADYQKRPRYRYEADVVNYVPATPYAQAVPMGEGFIDYRAFFQALEKAGFRGSVAYEMCSPLLDGGDTATLDRYARRFLDYMAEY